MTDIIMAIDPDAAHREWARQVEYHLGLVPALLGATVTLAAPKIGVSRGGSRFDKPQITGGGFHDEAPVIDAGPAVDATYLWDMFAEYTTAVGAWLGAVTNVPTRCPNTPTAAHDTALLIVGTLIAHRDLIWEHRQLDAFEQALFAEIRRQQRRHLPKWDGLPQHARPCIGDGEYPGCGSERAVRVRWEDDPSGGPKPRQIAVCRVCGHVYESKEQS